MEVVPQLDDETVHAIEYSLRLRNFSIQCLPFFVTKFRRIHITIPKKRAVNLKPSEKRTPLIEALFVLTCQI